MHRPILNPMGRGEVLAVDAPILLHVGSHSGDDVGCSLGFFSAEVALVVGVFASFNLIYNEVNRAETQGLVPESSISQIFYL